MGVMDGVKVLEVAEHGFVPSAAAILAEWGADVVKVERPTGDPLRQIMGMGFVADTGDFNFLFEQFNRNKRGVAIDLRTDGRAALDRLIEWADVFITNFLPSAHQAAARSFRHRQGEPALHLRDRIGSGTRGARRRQGRLRRGLVLGARRPRAHVAHRRAVSSYNPEELSSATRRAAYLAGGVAAALFKRERTGEPTVVDVSLLGAAVWTLSNDLVPTTILGVEPPRHVAGKSLSSVLVGSFRTADERWLSLNMLDPDRHWAPTMPGARARGAHRQARVRDRGPAPGARARAASDPRRAHRVAAARRAETAVGARHDLLVDRITPRGDQRRAGDCERIHARLPRTSDRAPLVVAVQVRQPGPPRITRARPGEGE